MSIFAPVLSTIERIVFPPGPMTSRILSLGMRMVMILGANEEISARGAARVRPITSRMKSLPSRAWASAFSMTARVTPATLMSI